MPSRTHVLVPESREFPPTGSNHPTSPSDSNASPIYRPVGYIATEHGSIGMRGVGRKRCGISLQAVLDEIRGVSAGTRSKQGKASGAKKIDEQLQALRKVDSGLRIVSHEAETSVAELSLRGSELLSAKSDAPFMKFVPVESLDDAIDLIGNSNSGPALAADHFGTSPTGKYLAHFIDAQVFRLNHARRDLLFGLVYPATQTVDLAARYTSDMLSWPRPGFAKIQPSSAAFAVQLASGNIRATQKVLKQALSPLKAMKRKPGDGVGMAFVPCVCSL